jgi:rhomboid protease GluP
MALSLALIALNVLMWLFDLALGLSPTAPSSQELLVHGANYLPATLKEPWRLLSAMFMHAGIIHLAFNMLTLVQFGPICESYYGRRGMLIVYFFSGILGGMASLFFGAAVTVSVGASGAIFGLQGAILCAVATKGNFLRPGAAKKIALAMGFIILLNLGLGLVTPAIDNAAHIGGLLGGFLVALLLAETFDPELHHKYGARRLLVAATVAVIALAALWQFIASLHRGTKLIVGLAF